MVPWPNLHRLQPEVLILDPLQSLSDCAITGWWLEACVRDAQQQGALHVRPYCHELRSIPAMQLTTLN